MWRKFRRWLRELLRGKSKPTPYVVEHEILDVIPDHESNTTEYKFALSVRKTEGSGYYS